MVSTATVSILKKCRLCRCKLEDTDPREGPHAYTCSDCRKHPAAGRPPAPPRPFNAADKALISKVHGYMPVEQLLAVLNDRLAADAPEATPHTIEQLHEELQALQTSSGAADWATLRKLLAQARRDGVLEQITAQTISDFAIVYSLTPAQVLRLKDVILSARSEKAA